jgi:hypothetical protein
LTAAHNLLVYDLAFNQKKNYKPHKFIFQSYPKKAEETFKVESFIIHPLYKKSKGVIYDIALVICENRRYFKFDKIY